MKKFYLIIIGFAFIITSSKIAPATTEICNGNLYYPVKNGDLKKLQSFLKPGFNVNCRFEGGFMINGIPMLYIASKEGHMHLVSFFDK